LSQEKDGKKDEDKDKASEENKLGIVMFFGGIWWKKRRVISHEWKTEEEKKKQEYLGDNSGESPGVFVEDPQKPSDSEEAFFELAPGIVGQGLPSDNLPTYNDSFEIFEDESGDEEEV